MNARTSIAVMDQFMDPSVSGNNRSVSSALAHVGLKTVDASANTDSGYADTVKLIEKPVTGLLVLRATQCADELSKALQERCGIALSKRLLSATKGEYCIRWMSPDSWLLSCPLDEAFAIENALRENVNGHVAIVNVSGGYSVMDLSGTYARAVLKKSTGYDVHPDNFPAGKVVNTTFAKSQLTLRCIEASEGLARYELIVRRSFSDYVWLWLQRASAEYGLTALSQK